MANGRSRSRPDPVLISGIPLPGQPAKPEDMFRLVRKARRLRRSSYGQLGVWTKALLISLVGWGVVAAAWFGWHLSQPAPGTDSPQDVSSPELRATPAVVPEVNNVEVKPQADSASGLKVYLHQRDRAEMVYVPTGNCYYWDPNTLGSAPQVVTVPGFLIDRFEVTNERYDAFVQQTGHKPGPLANNSHYNDSRFPVVGISYRDAEAYCQWCHKRLPNLKEWLRAARKDQDCKYPWGDAAPAPGDQTHAKFAPNRDVTPDRGVESQQPLAFLAPVGTHPDGRSFYGCDDMAGNAAEFLEDIPPVPTARAGSNRDDGDRDWQRFRVDPPAEGAAAASGEGLNMVVGGSWADPVDRITTRSWHPVDPDAGLFTAGFRTVCEAVQSSPR